LEVREAVIGTKIAWSVRMNQRLRRWPCAVAGKRAWNCMARAGKIDMECGLV
jgi:hypothetical protein